MSNEQNSTPAFDPHYGIYLVRASVAVVFSLFLWWLNIFKRRSISLTWFLRSCRLIYLLDWLFAIPNIAIEIIAINKSEDKVGLEFSSFFVSFHLIRLIRCKDGNNRKLNSRSKEREKQGDEQKETGHCSKLCIHFRLVFLLALNHDSICRLWEKS